MAQTAIKTTLDEYLNTNYKIDLFNLKTILEPGTNENQAINGNVEIIGNHFSEKENEKYSFYRKTVLNTHAFPYAFTLSALQSDNTLFPEVAFMFIKTYIKQLFDDTDRLRHEELYKVFNKNQELIEIPYPVVLYLGGLYYFTENQPNTKDISKYLFSTTNNLTIKNPYSYLENPLKNDVYDSDTIKRVPFFYAGYDRYGNSANGSTHHLVESIYRPSMKVLNRSLYNLHDSVNEYFADNFTIKTKLNGETNEVLIPTKLAMPCVGFGIQNQFLNQYNKIMFGDYLNGTKDMLETDKPHSTIGAYCGISKPIKTYKSYDTEFTAFYRNLYVSGFSYKIEDLVNELSSATKDVKKDYGDSLLNNGDDENKYILRPDKTYVDIKINAKIPKKTQEDLFLSENFPYVKIIKSFIVYSKLKANYLSGSIANDTDLSTAIKELCSVKNIDSAFNRDRKSKELYEISDFYFLVSHMFFASFAQIIRNYRTPNLNSMFDIRARLNFGMGADNGNGNYDYEYYQKFNLPENLNKKLNGIEIKSIDDEVLALTDLFTYIWNLEKINLKENFKSVSGTETKKAVYALYPSCGGGITPKALFKTKATGYLDLNVYNSIEYETDYISQTVYRYLYNNDPDPKADVKKTNFKNVQPNPKEFNDISVPSNIIANGSEIINNTITSISTINSEDSFKFINDAFLYNEFDDKKNPILWHNSPWFEKYFVKKDDVGYSNAVFYNYDFDNQTVLKNTTKFFWFDSTNYGDALKCEYNSDDNLNKTTPNRDNLSGVDLAFDYYDNRDYRDYFTLNINDIFKYGDFEKLKDKKFFEQYSLSNLMDSLDFEKLEKFKDLFLDFSKLNGKSSEVYNEGTHTLRSLMLSSSCISYSDLETVTYENNAWTKEEINLMLIGNSIFQYEFCSESGISHILNYALSMAQYNIFNNVVDEFCSSLVTVANFSPNTAIAYDSKTISSLHKTIGLSEILFSNREKYEDILNLLQYTTDNQKNKAGLYFARKILFGDEAIESFTILTSEENKELELLNKQYLINSLYTQEKFEDNLDELYKQAVTSFFSDLNVKYTKNRYKQLNRLIRTYVYRLFNSNSIINENALPNKKPFIWFSDIEKYKKTYNIG